jgi:hypothetical protein
MIGRSGAPATDKDTKWLSLHRRSINWRSHGRSTSCGSEKKFRKVQIRYARCAKLGCTYRGPIGVSSSRTPSVSFSIHMTTHLGEDGKNCIIFEGRYYCTGDAALGSNLFIFVNISLHTSDQLENGVRCRFGGADCSMTFGSSLNLSLATIRCGREWQQCPYPCHPPPLLAPPKPGRASSLRVPIPGREAA